jgi:hypothetical protein
MANGLIGSYSPNDVAVVYGGIPLTGHPEGELVSAAFDNDAATVTQGSDGGVAVARQRGPRLATVKVRLQQTSLANNAMQALAAAQSVPGFAAYPTLQILNAQGGEAAVMARGVIAKEPDLVYSDKIEPREWTIKGLAVINFAGYEV